MSQADYDYLRMTGELPATNETFISPTYSFSSDYDGITVEFELRKGTTNSLLDIGVGNNADQAIRDYCHKCRKAGLKIMHFLKERELRQILVWEKVRH